MYARPAGCSVPPSRARCRPVGARAAWRRR